MSYSTSSDNSNSYASVQSTTVLYVFDIDEIILHAKVCQASLRFISDLAGVSKSL